MNKISVPTPDGLRALRDRLGLTQAALAGLLGVSPRTVMRWEAGQTRIPRAAWIALLAQ